MSTFKSSISDRTATIDGLGYPELCIRNSNGEVLASIALSEKDAPAIALAVLEAAGFDQGPFPDHDAEEATYRLQRHVRESESKAAAAAEEAELKREAKELYYASRGPDEAYQLWLHLGEGERGKWGRAARRARELAKERTK